MTSEQQLARTLAISEVDTGKGRTKAPDTSGSDLDTSGNNTGNTADKAMPQNNQVNKSTKTAKTKTQHKHKPGWGQFHFFNSIPIPIPLFSIPIPILLLTISFNSNSNSGDFNSNSNSNSGDFKSRQSQFWKWPDVFLEIDYNYTSKVHAYKIIVINTISLISLVKWL